MKEVKILSTEGFFNVVAPVFEKKLNELLKDGWEMSGDMSVVPVSPNGEPLLVYSQKLIKEV